MTVVNFNKFTEMIKVPTYRYTKHQNIKTTLLISNRGKKVARYT